MTTAAPSAAIREFRPDDLEEAWRLDQTCFEDGIAYTRGQIRDFLGRDGAVALAADGPDGTLAAFAIGHVAGSRGHLVTIDIGAADRRRGLGRRLLDALTERMAAAGVREMRLEVDAANAGAVRFYEQAGYRTSRRLPDYYGAGRDGLRMTRRIAAIPKARRPGTGGA